MSSGPIKLSVSVRELVEFSAASGDLFSENYAGPSALEGIRAHQSIQSSRSSDWHKEQKLESVYEFKDCALKLAGRVDLMCLCSDAVILEEIKTTYLDQDALSESQLNLHWAQLKLYAWLYVRSSDSLAAGQTMICRATWYNLPRKQEHSEDRYFSRDELDVYAKKLIGIYLDWYLAWRSKAEEERKWAKALQFPFASFREGQRELANDVYLAIKHKRHLLVEAATGTGKSISTLFPAVKYFGQSKLTQIVYLSAKGSAQQNARTALEVMSGQSSGLRYLCIQAKERACACRSNDSSRQQSCVSKDGLCSRTIGFFDRLPEARLDCLNSSNLDTSTLQSIADKHHLCAFELSLQMIRWSSVVVCDLNYVFDPMVRLAVFDKNTNQRVMLCDEAHSFVDRSRDMFSAQLSSKACMDLHRALPNTAKSIKVAIKNLAHCLDECSEETLKELNAAVENMAHVLGQEAARVLTNAVPDGGSQGLVEFSKSIYRFMAITQLLRDEHTVLIEAGRVELRCMDAASLLRDQYKKARALIGFSATLSPMYFYARMLGLQEQCFSHQSSSYFPPENQLTLRCDYIDTRWRQRDESIQPLCELIHSLASAKLGKYLVFFPSYQYMESVVSAFNIQFPQWQTVTQESESSERQREEFLSHFTTVDRPVIGFAILGGVFGEGVDFAGDALTGVVVVGAGMPQPSELNKRMQSYFELLGLNGFQFTYQFPGLTRVKQTAGRVIRSGQDRGVVILVDPRFKQSQYDQHLPASWNLQPCENEDVIGRKLHDFWAEDFVLSGSRTHDG
jgi:DNA excision repair protein ERCC-2